MKTIFKIGITLVEFGWFIFMWFVLWGYDLTTTGRLIVFFSGFTICIFGAVCATGLAHNKGYWLKNEELDELIEKHKEAIKLYNEAKEKLIMKTLREK